MGDIRRTLIISKMFNSDGTMNDHTDSRPTWESDPKWSDVIRVTIEDGVTYIGDRTFSDCTVIEAIVVPSSVTTIGDMAFYNCKNLKAANLVNGLVSIGDSSFGYCESLDRIYIPSSVTTIGDMAFSGCHNVVGIYYKSPTWNIVSIGERAFNLDLMFEPIHHTIYSIDNIAQGKLDGYFDFGSDISYANWEKGNITYTWMGPNGTVLQIDEDVKDNEMPAFRAPFPTNGSLTFSGWDSKESAGTVLMEAKFIEGQLTDIGGNDGGLFFTDADSQDHTVAVVVVVAIMAVSIIAWLHVKRE